MSKSNTDIIIQSQFVKGGWAGDETRIYTDDFECVYVDGDLAFANDYDVDEFCKIVKEMIANLS